MSIEKQKEPLSEGSLQQSAVESIEPQSNSEMIFGDLMGSEKSQGEGSNKLNSKEDLGVHFEFNHNEDTLRSASSSSTSISTSTPSLTSILPLSQSQSQSSPATLVSTSAFTSSNLASNSDSAHLAKSGIELGEGSKALKDKDGALSDSGLKKLEGKKLSFRQSFSEFLVLWVPGLLFSGRYFAFFSAFWLIKIGLLDVPNRLFMAIVLSSSWVFLTAPLPFLVFFLLLIVVPSLSFVTFVRKGWDLAQSCLMTLVLSVFAALSCLMSLSLVQRRTPWSLWDQISLHFSESVVNWLAQVIQMSRSSEIGSESSLSLQFNQELASGAMAQMVRDDLFASYVIVTLLVVVLNFALVYRVYRHRFWQIYVITCLQVQALERPVNEEQSWIGIAYRAIRPGWFEKFKVPEWCVWIPIVALFWVLAQAPYPVVAQNILRVMTLLYTFQGISIFLNGFSALNLRPSIQLVSMVFFMVLLAPMICIIGFFDLWADFRARFKRLKT